jgi:hypothetical protein
MLVNPSEAKGPSIFFIIITSIRCLFISAEIELFSKYVFHSFPLQMGEFVLAFYSSLVQRPSPSVLQFYFNFICT